MTRIRNNFVRFALLIALLGLPNRSDVHAGEANPTEQISEAIEVYRSAMDSAQRNDRVQQFRRAESLFRRAAETLAPVDAELYVCIGNAAMGAERLGPAIAAFHRALELDRDNRQALQNLRHARTLLPDRIPHPDEAISLGTFVDWFRQLGTSEWSLIGSGLFACAAVLIALYFRFETTVLRNVGVILGVGWIAMIGLMFATRRLDPNKIVIVVNPETVARSADSIFAPARIADPLPSGTETQLIEDRGEWLRVRLYDSREAWLQRSAVDLVTRSS